MRVLITGGGGFLGQKLAKALSASGQIRGRAIEAMVLCDIAQPANVDASFDVSCVTADISDQDAVSQLFAKPYDAIWHLAAVVSGAAEADLDLGMRVNLNGTINILEAARASGTVPIFVFASSCAAHGGEEPTVVPDGVELNPQTSYGTQKAMGELLVNDFSRRGLIDGRGLRLPTVSVRPGKPNAAASSFMSSIFRDTMQGDVSNCPVNRDFPLWHTAPRTVVANLVKAAEIPAADFGFNRNLNLPGRTDTVGEMIDAMTQVFGPEAEARITWDKDPVIEKIVMGWRSFFEPKRAIEMGFEVDQSFSDSVRYFLEDDIA